VHSSHVGASLAASALLAACLRASHPEPAPFPRPCPGSSAAVVLQGVVRDTSGAPIALAQVIAYPAQVASTTDRWGRYALAPVPAGPVRLRAQMVGYEPLDLATCADGRDGKVTFIDFVLEPRSSW
jgi:hypothetical protein